MRLLGKKDMVVIGVLRELGKCSARDVYDYLTERNEKMPYTTISSILNKLHDLGIVERRVVKSKGRYGKKYVYSLKKRVESENEVLVEIYSKVLEKSDLLLKLHDVGGAVAFVDKDGNVVFVYGGGEVIKDEKIIGKKIEDVHAPVTAKFVRHIFEELRSGKRTEFRRTINVEGRVFEKIYYAIRSLEGDFLGVIVITREIKEEKKPLEEVLLP